jgi:hypothetical protein
MDTWLEGGCLCGAVRYRVREIFDAGYCHCSVCHRAHGAPVMAWAGVALVDFEILRGLPRAYASSENGRRFFCSDCGTQLWFGYAEGGRFVSISLGTLDEPDRVEPRRHIWTSSRLRWFDLRDDLPRHPDGRIQDHPDRDRIRAKLGLDPER